jgi:hypothetical protein
MTPQEFCRQGLAVLRLQDDADDSRVRAPLEALLLYFAADDVRPDVFEFQLQLLAESVLCPDLGAAAARVLGFWRGERMGRLAVACRVHRN